MKVKGGKFIKVSLNSTENIIKKIQIKGDFFAYPEEIIVTIEKELQGSKIEKETLTKKIRLTIKKQHSTLFGIDPESIAEAIIGCVK